MNIFRVLNGLQTSINIILKTWLIKKYNSVLMLLTCIAIESLFSVNYPLTRTIKIKIRVCIWVSCVEYELTLIQNPVENKDIFKIMSISYYSSTCLSEICFFVLLDLLQTHSFQQVITVKRDVYIILVWSLWLKKSRIEWWINFHYNLLEFFQFSVIKCALLFVFQIFKGKYFTQLIIQFLVFFNAIIRYMNALKIFAISQVFKKIDKLFLLIHRILEKLLIVIMIIK
jgi:hypothetical protein